MHSVCIAHTEGLPSEGIKLVLPNQSFRHLQSTPSASHPRMTESPYHLPTAASVVPITVTTRSSPPRSPLSLPVTSHSIQVRDLSTRLNIAFARLSTEDPDYGHFGTGEGLPFYPWDYLAFKMTQA